MLALFLLISMAVSGPSAPRSVTAGPYAISWTDSQIRVGVKGKHQVLFQNVEDETSSSTYILRSVVGPWISVDHGWYGEGGAHPTYGTKRMTADATRGGRAIALDELFDAKIIVKQLLADSVIRAHLEGPTPASLDALLQQLDGGCEMDLGPQLLTSWAFHHLKGDQVAVRIGVSYGCEVMRGAFTEIGIYLPISPMMEAYLNAAAQQGTLMKNLAQP